MKTLTTHYTFHGLGIAVSGEPSVSAAIHSRLRQFTSNGCSCDLTFEFWSVPAGESHAVERPSEHARPVYESSVGEVIYIDGADQLYINYDDRVRVLSDLGRGSTLVSFLSELNNLWLISHPMFTLPLLELLKRRGRYSLHAAGLSINGKGLLIAGTSGAGKSTLTITLLRAGFGFLGDDMTFLAPGRDGLRALAFPDEIDVTDETACMFSELHHLLRLPSSSGWPKRQVPAEELYSLESVRECRPVALVFPRIADAKKSVVRPMSRDEALLELVPNVLLTQAASSQTHFDILAQLVSDTACYRLETGRDFDELPTLLRDVVEQTQVAT